MTTPRPFEAEDQTDEDFFNNLTVDDDEIGLAGSRPDDDGIVRNFSNLSIGDFAESGSGTGEDEFSKLEEPETQGIGDSEPSELTDKSALENTTEAEAAAASTPAPAPADTVGLPAEIIGATNGTGGGDSKAGGVVKSTGVKVVQWSAFSVDSQQSDFSGFGFDSNSDFLTENSDSFGSSLAIDGDPFGASGFGSIENSAAVTTFTADIGLKSSFQSPVADVATHTITDATAHAQSTDVSDSQYWENMYPGWKFDPSTGQWYQIDGYDASANINNLAGSSVQDTFQENVHEASSGFISDQQSDISYFQQTSQSMVGTVTENFAANNVSNLNLVSQGTTEFPSHMVFDPQYPEWYYDTNMQQWLTLESYYATVQRTSDAVQELSIPSNGSVTGENNGFYGSYSGENQYGQNTVELHDSHDSRQGGSYSGENQYGQNTVELHDNHDARQGGSLSSFVQPNTWLPKTLSKSTAGFENTNTLQQHFNASNGFAAKENTGVVQYESNTAQGHDNKDATRGWSMGNYVPPKTWLPEPVNQSTISFSNDSTVHAVNNDDQQNGLHSSATPFTNVGYGSTTGSSSFPSFVPAESQERKSSLGFSNNQHIGNFHGSTEHAANYVDQHKGLNATAPFPGYGYHNTSDSTVVPSFVPAESQEQRNASLSNNQHTGNFHGSAEHAANYMNPQKSLNASTPFQGHGYRSTNASTAFPSFVPAESQEHSSVGFSNDQYTGNFHASTGHAANYVDQQQSLNVSMPFPASVYGSKNEQDRFPSFPPAEMMYQYTNQSKLEKRQHDMYGNQISEDYSQQPFQITNVPYSQFSNTHSEGRSSAGRPAHALVTFGFGGKLIVMRDPNSLGTKMDHGSQDDATGSVSILSLMEVLTDKISNSDATAYSCDYARALLQESFPGPLVNGKNASSKDVNKWVDEKIANCESSIMGSGKGEYLKLLLSLLKLSCQQYGKLRSPFGTDPSIEEPDAPELSVAKLFASARKSSGSSTEYGSFMHCMQSLPSEGQIQATAFEVQNLLVSGRRKDALCCAQAGQLWGPALVLASQLGEQFYVDTVRQMAHRQLISGSPLKTLCLLIAGQAADVFSAEIGDSSGAAYASNVPQRSSEIPANGMLNDWVENLAVITANRTKDDHLVIIHLGDCLWKERGEITAAHTCYLVAEENLQPYSESARFCLIGADHWRHPRTYASPEAIQITELYEYSKVLGNSQFMMLPLQPYKLVYAYMLAEVGRVADSLRYCQASLKLLKNSSRAPEVETWKSLLSSLEERIRTHQQGGFTSNLAPAKFVGKLMTSIDKSIHRMMGAPPLPPMPPSGGNGKENYSVVPKGGSQSSMDMPSLIPSPSVEGMNEWSGDSNKMSVHNRSISEPNFGQSPKQDANSSNVQSKATPPGGSSRFGRIGSSLLQRTMGWVSISRSDRQAKLGETNKFYYDDKLKRWVEEGAEPPADEPALQPPPIMASFQNGTSNFGGEGSLNAQSFVANGEPEMKPPLPSGYSSGFPNASPSPNHFSARASGGIRSRYVDTFNKGGGSPMKLFQSPPAASFKPPPVANFFVPAAPAPFDEQTANSEAESIPEADANGEASAPVDNRGSFSPPPPIIHRFPSMDSIPNSSNNAQSSGDSFSRFRASSWSGSVESKHNPNDSKPNPFGAMSHKQFMQVNTSNRQPGTSPLQVNGGSDDLHEVEL